MKDQIIKAYEEYKGSVIDDGYRGIIAALLVIAAAIKSTSSSKDENE